VALRWADIDIDVAWPQMECNGLGFESKLLGEKEREGRKLTLHES
jgi:hypothetical protein